MTNKENDKMEKPNPIVQDEAPMAVLPLNSSAKLDQEPNPFEKSFSGASVEETAKDKLKLPPVTAITSPSPVLIVNNNENNNNNNGNSNSQPPQQPNVIGGGVLPKEISNQFTWETLRTGPLSPSMLQGPANPDEYYSTATTSNGQLAPPQIYSSRSSFNSTAATVKMEAPQPMYLNQYQTYQPNPYPQQHMQQHSQPLQEQPRARMRQSSTNSHLSNNTTASNSRKRSLSNNDDDNHSMDSNDSSQQPQSKSRRRSSAVTSNSEDDQDKQSNGNSNNGGGGAGRKKSKSSGKTPEDDEKRRNFLERNRIAALKCRQRKKQWLNNLQAKVEFLTSDNERLQLQSESLKEEIVNLKTLLLAHKDCPIAQANGFHPNSIQKAMPSMLSTQHMLRSGMPPPPNAGAPMPPTSATTNTTTTMGMMSAPPPPSFLTNRTSTTNTATTTSAPPPPSVSAAASSLSSIPQYQRTATATSMGIPVPPQQANHPQQSMVAGGSSNVLRF